MKTRPPKSRLALYALTLAVLVGAGAYLYWAHWTYRFETIDPGKVYSSAAMPPARLEAYVRRYGLRTVIDLRGTRLQPEVSAESAALAPMGVRHIHLPSKQVPSPAVVERFLEVMGDPQIYPVLIHCDHGQGRAMVLAAIYRMEFQGWDNARALDAARWINMGTSFDRDTSKGRYILQYATRRAKSGTDAGMAGAAPSPTAAVPANRATEPARGEGRRPSHAAEDVGANR